MKNIVKRSLSNPVIVNILIVGSITFGIKLISFYKETLVAGTFGLSLLLDTFFIAVLVPSFIQNVFIGAIRNIFIPNYITELNTTKEKESFQSIVFCLIAVIMVFFTIFTYTISDVLVETIFPNKTYEFYQLVRLQLYFLLPSLFFMGFSSIIGSLLEIENKFFASSLPGVFPAISTIVSLLLFKEVLGDYVLAVGFLGGTILVFTSMLIISYSKGLIKLKRPRLNDNSRVMLKQLPAKITSGVLTGINPFVDQYFAAQLAIGSISAINYGVKIPAFVSSITIIAIGNVILPYFSKLINENLQKAYQQLFRILKMVFLSILVIILILMYFSDGIISLLFERQEFSSEDTVIVANVQKIILAYVPFTICGIVIVKFLTSINENKFMAYTSFFNLILNIVLNIILVKKFGLYGLALSTTIVYILSAIIYFLYTRNLYRKLRS